MPLQGGFVINQRRIMQFAVLSLVGVVLAVTGFNCSPSKMYSMGSSSNESSSVSKSEDLPYALLNADQALSSMLNVTGQAMPSTGVRNEFNIRNAAFAVNSYLSSINAPMLLSATSLAGEVCNSLVNSERAAGATRAFFKGVNFTAGPNQITDATFQNVLNLFSQKVWARALTEEEASLFSQYRGDYVTALPAPERSQATKTTAFYMSICSAFLSSFDALIF
jgi:hypothetical protein